MHKYKILVFLLIMSLWSVSAKGQDYRYEIGGMAGTSFYMGDANKTKLYQNVYPSLGAIFRYNKDFRWSLKTNLVIGKVGGDTKKSDNVFPFAQTTSFERLFYELGGQVEFNFFNYSNDYAYLNTTKFTPYVFTGIGFTYAAGGKSFFDANIPLGIGMKYKIKERFNLGFEFSFRRLFRDDFDVTQKEGFNLDDPYDIKSGPVKNKDWYSLTMITLTWDFGPRCKDCLNLY